MSEVETYKRNYYSFFGKFWHFKELSVEEKTRNVWKSLFFLDVFFIITDIIGLIVGLFTNEILILFSVVGIRINIYSLFYVIVGLFFLLNLGWLWYFYRRDPYDLPLISEVLIAIIFLPGATIRALPLFFDEDQIGGGVLVFFDFVGFILLIIILVHMFQLNRELKGPKKKLKKKLKNLSFKGKNIIHFEHELRKLAEETDVILINELALKHGLDPRKGMRIIRKMLKRGVLIGKIDEQVWELHLGKQIIKNPQMASNQPMNSPTSQPVVSPPLATGSELPNLRDTSFDELVNLYNKYQTADQKLKSREDTVKKSLYFKLRSEYAEKLEKIEQEATRRGIKLTS